MKQNLKLALNYSSVKCSNLMDLWILQDFLMQFLVKVNLFNSRNLSTVGIGNEIGSQSLPRGIKLDSLHIKLSFLSFTPPDQNKAKQSRHNLTLDLCFS